VKINTVQDVQKFLDGQYITMAEFAALAGIHRSNMYGILKGRIALTRRMRLRIQRAVDELNVNPPEVAAAPGTREARMSVLVGL
jgi:predicted transcriptional regulator